MILDENEKEHIIYNLSMNNNSFDLAMFFLSDCDITLYDVVKYHYLPSNKNFYIDFFSIIIKHITKNNKIKTHDLINTIFDIYDKMEDYKIFYDGNFKKAYKGNDKLHEINNLVLLFNYQLIQYLNNKDSYRIDLFIFVKELYSKLDSYKHLPLELYTIVISEIYLTDNEIYTLCTLNNFTLEYII